jgi:aromatic ring-opening dioxygenase catalytic subunit (LigB family)
MNAVRQPAMFLSHGGGPCFSMDIPGEPFERLRVHLAGLLGRLPGRPAAIVIVSGHWEEDVTAVGTAAAPGMIYDYHNFPPHTYELSHPAPGAPKLARRILGLLTEAGIPAKADEARGYDHGTFVPMMVVDPDATIPLVTVSLRRDLDPAAHLAVGRALAPLRDENVLVVGSGNSFHNLRTFRNGEDAASGRFDAWLTEAVAGTDAATRDRALIGWEAAPGARECHPEAEHLLPLMVAAGAAGSDVGVRDYHDVIWGKRISGYRFG